MALPEESSLTDMEPRRQRPAAFRGSAVSGTTLRGLSRLEAAARHSSGRPQRLQRHPFQSLGSEISAESSRIAASTSLEAPSPSCLLFSERKFWAFSESHCLFQGI